MSIVHTMFMQIIERWCTDPNGTRVPYEGQCWCGCCDPTPPNEPCIPLPDRTYCPPYEYAYNVGNCTATGVTYSQPPPPEIVTFLFCVSLVYIFAIFVLIVRHIMHSLRRTHA